MEFLPGLCAIWPDCAGWHCCTGCPWGASPTGTCKDNGPAQRGNKFASKGQSVNSNKWLSRLTEVTQDYALVPPLWHYGYECLFSGHKIRPPLWVRAWMETQMTLNNMTKEELKVWRMVKARLAEDQAQGNVIDKQGDASRAAATAIAESR